MRVVRTTMTRIPDSERGGREEAEGHQRGVRMKSSNPVLFHIWLDIGAGQGMGKAASGAAEYGSASGGAM